MDFRNWNVDFGFEPTPSGLKFINYKLQSISYRFGWEGSKPKIISRSHKICTDFTRKLHRGLQNLYRNLYFNRHELKDFNGLAV